MKKKLLFTTFIALTSLASFAQTTLAKWTFEQDIKSESSISANNGIEITVSDDIFFYGRLNYDGYNSEGFYSAEDFKFVGGQPKGFVVFPGISTKGNYSKIVVKFAMRMPNANLWVPKEYRVDANIDGSATWTSLKPVKPVRNRNWQFFEVEMTSEVLNKEKVDFRIAANTNLDFNGDSGAEGSLEIDEVQFVGIEDKTGIADVKEGVSYFIVKNKELIITNDNVSKIEIFNKLGSKVYSKAGSENVALDGFAGDMYIVRITDNNETVTTQKIIIK